MEAGDAELLERATTELDANGFTVLPDRLGRPDALALGAALLEAHEPPGPGCDDSELYQSVHGHFNRDERTWACAMDPVVLALAAHYLGEGFRLMDACSRPSWPGFKGQPTHTDLAVLFRQVPPPELPWLLNTNWMLSDFTRTNGATACVPMSHRSGRAGPAEGHRIEPVPVLGSAGSVLVFHPALHHGAGANTAAPGDESSVRVGLQISYHATWCATLPPHSPRI